MPEYIDKLSVVNRLVDLENEFQQYKQFHGFEHAMYRKICEAEIAIGKTPAADVAPVRHGYWVGLEYDGYADGNPVYYLWECSECGEEVRGEDVPDTHTYCYGCGAIMDLK